jgi:hypothetical protein
MRLSYENRDTHGFSHGRRSGDEAFTAKNSRRLIETRRSNENLAYA